MALMFPRLAQNFIKNGYYPTDEPTLERILNAIAPAQGSQNTFRILDPCAGEGVAIAEAAHSLEQLGHAQVQACAVEYDVERANHASHLVDRCIQGDLMDTIISRQAFGLMFLNPPYGDLSRDQHGNYGYEGQGRARLEKLFYQRSLPLLQYDGVMVLIMPFYVLDAEFVGWLTRHFADLRVYRAVDTQFKQVVMMGRRIRQREQDLAVAKQIRQHLTAIGCGEIEAEELPETWTLNPYIVPGVQTELEHFYRVTLEPAQFASEVAQLGGLWPEFDTHFNVGKLGLRPPARALSQWHLALALAAGAISGAVRSKTGKVYVLKGDTHKEKSLKTEYTEREDGSMAETRILTDKFVPVIRAWDMTPDSSTYGCVLTISSGAGATESKQPQTTDAPSAVKFDGGRLVMTGSVASAMDAGSLDVFPFVRRHFAGDWGEVDEADKRRNNQALKSGEERLFSSYELDSSAKLWIITEWDRSVTTVLFPSDY